MQFIFPNSETKSFTKLIGTFQALVFTSARISTCYDAKESVDSSYPEAKIDTELLLGSSSKSLSPSSPIRSTSFSEEHVIIESAFLQCISSIISWQGYLFHKILTRSYFIKGG